MITQLIRVRNAFVPESDPRAYGYVIGKKPYFDHWQSDHPNMDREMIISWCDGTVQEEKDHRRNVAWRPPIVFLTNRTSPTHPRGSMRGSKAPP